MTDSTRMDVPVLLPGVEDEQDACVERLVDVLLAHDGVTRAHVTRAAGTAVLCLHYDPAQLSLERVRQLAMLAGAELTDRFAHVVVPFHDIASEDQGRRLEQELLTTPGITYASVNYAGQVARVEYDRRMIDEARITLRFEQLRAVPASTGVVEKPAPDGWYARHRELAWSLTAGGLLAAAWAGQRLQVMAEPVALSLYALAYVFGARDTVGHVFADVRRGRVHFNIDLLMIVAAAGAAIIGAWTEGALLLFLFSLGHALEHYALGRARHAISALAELAPTRATRLSREGRVTREETVPIGSIRAGDLVVVKPAERLPVDGVVENGVSSVNQAPITGESAPVQRSVGDTVFAGSVNGDGALTIRVTSAVGDRTLDRVIRLVADAETQKAPTQRFTDRFERVFVPLVLVVDGLLLVIPSIAGWWTWSESLYRAMALLVAASPCALALGTPAAVLAGIAQAARRGVLIKGGAHLEALGAVEVLALDKTGTITKGEPTVIDRVPMAGVTEEELLTMAAAVERRSQHPIARAVMAAADLGTLDDYVIGDVVAINGRGIRSSVNGDPVDVGRLLMFEEEPAGAAIPDAIHAAVTRLEQLGRTTVVVRRGTRWLGVLGIADEARPDVAQTLIRLREVGITRIVMLTGDNIGVATAVGQAVGIDDVRAGLLPEDKVTAIKELANEGRVAMVGDGVNDAPALAHATVGIAMGGAGTAAALETADVALMGDDLGRLPFAIGLSRSTRRVIRQNLFVSLGVIAVLVVATVTGVVGIGPAVVVHEGSTLVVIVNALRLLRYEERVPTRT